MVESFLFIALPYLSLFVLIFGSIYRHWSKRFTYSSLSSQLLEGRSLLWGSVPFHLGILILLAGHSLPVIVPGLWQTLTAHHAFLIGVEAIGFLAGALSLGGLTVLAFRRLTASKLRAVTSPMDLVVLVLLLLQVVLGAFVAVGYRWGAAWSRGTTTPYFWSLVTFQPDPSYVTQLPLIIKIHLTGAWILFFVVPFSRLVHLFSFPFSYAFRPPLKVVWANRRYLDGTRFRKTVGVSK